MKLIQHVEIDPSWPEYGVRPDGTPIRLADVEALLPAGELRAQVHYVSAKGFKVWPWKDAGYYEDDAGAPLAPVFDVVPMPRHELVARGLDDATVWRECVRNGLRSGPSPLVGPDTSEVQVARRKAYDDVAKAWYRTSVEG